MSPKSLPPRPSLEQYRKQAKDLLRSYRASDPAARSRVRESHPGARAFESDQAAFALADAQWVLAREHGFESWPKFAGHIQDLAKRVTPTHAVFPLRISRLKIATSEVYSAQFSSDGSRALVGAAGCQVGLWDTASGECVGTFEPTSLQTYALNWRHDSPHALIGESDGIIGLWGVESAARRWSFTGHHAEIRCVDMSPDLRRAASGCARRDLTIRIWDLDDLSCSRQLAGHTDGVYTVAFNSGMDRLLSGSRDTTLRLWDTSTGECRLVMRGHKYHVHCATWSPDELTAASCSRSIRLWNLRTGHCILVLDGHVDTIRSISWSRDGRRLLSASHDGTARLWDVSSGECLATMHHSVGLVSVAFDAQEEHVVAADWLGSVCTWALT